MNPPQRPGPLRLLLLVLGLAAVYLAVARLSLLMQLPGTNASPVWPPAGIAVAALMLFGMRAWPGVAVGAFLANLWTLPFTAAGVCAAGAIGAGNTLEAVVAFVVLRRLVPSMDPFDNPRGLWRFLLTTVVASAVASTIGTASLWLSGIVGGHLCGPVWFTWWLGDAAGVVVLVPALVSWARRPWGGLPTGRWLEFAALVGVSAFTAELTFGGWLPVAVPFLVVAGPLWAAFRFGPRETSLLPVLLSVLTITHVWHSANRPAGADPTGYVPFVSGVSGVNDSLLMLQLFVCTVSVTALILSAAVAERRHTEEQLRESESRFRTIFDQAAVGVALIDTASGRFLRVNEWYCRFIGYTHDEMTATTFMAISHPDDLQADLDQMRRLVAGEIGEFTMEKRLVCKGGRVVWINLTVSPKWRPGEPPERHIAIVEDITARRRAEDRLRELNATLEQRVAERTAALRKREERFKAIFHSQFQFIGLLTTDGRVIEANHTALAAAGVREEDVIEKPFWETSWWTHDAPQQERLKQAVRTAAGGAQDRFEASHPTADDGLMWVDFSLTPFRDESGRVALLIPEGREISDRKRVEERLRESEERFELAVRGSQDGIWDWHITTGAVYFSPQWKGMLGYAENEVEHSFVQWERLVHPDDRPSVKAALGAYLDGSAPAYAVEIRMRHKDGGDRWILTRGVAVRDAAGKPTRMAGSHTDITDRKAAEEALRLSEARFKSLAANAPVGIYETDAVGNCLFVNARWCWKAGLTPEEAAGHGWVAAIHPDDRERVAAEWYAAAEAGQEFVSDYRFRTPDGRVTWLSGRAVCIRDEAGRAHGHIGTVMNVTDRREAESKLRASEERYRSVVDALAEGIVVQDAGGRIVAHNRRAEQVLGLSSDQLVGRTSLDPRWRAVRENGTPLPGYEHPSMVALRTRRPVFNTLMGVEQPAGGRTWLTVNAVPFGTDGGSVVASFHDVTEARRLNEQILASLHEKEVMLREIHHRVKNNLAVIASLFHLQTGYVTDDTTRRLLEEAQARVRSMALVHEHLYTANDLGAVSFSDYANTLVGQLFRSYRLPTAAVALATDIRPVTLGVDQAIPCGLILNELVSNALKHGFPDGRAGTLTVGLCERDGACEVRVADDGAGIPPDRLQGRPKSLGLRLVRSLTRQLDGTVDFTPTHPGTEVRVTFAIGRPAGATHD